MAVKSSTLQLLSAEVSGIGGNPSHETGAADEWLTPRRFALLLGLLIVATFPGVLLGSPTFVIRDFGMFGYPLAYFHRQSFWRGHLPLWNPFSNGGLPFLAQWNTLTLYPLSLIYLLLPLTWSLPFFCLAHMFWGGLGMYFLAYRWTGQRWAAGLAGLIFAFNGLTLNALMWPNVVATLGWLPWVVWLGQCAWGGGGSLGGGKQMGAPGTGTIPAAVPLPLPLRWGGWIGGGGPGEKNPLRFFG